MKTYLIYYAVRNVVKVGRSIHPERRIKDLQVSCPDPLVLLAFVDEDCELEIHRHLSGCLLKGEWIDLSNPQAREYLESRFNVAIPVPKGIRTITAIDERKGTIREAVLYRENVVFTSIGLWDEVRQMMEEDRYDKARDPHFDDDEDDFDRSILSLISLLPGSTNVSYTQETSD